ISSEAGRGTEVVVSLPVSKAPARLAEAPAPKAGVLAGRRVLVVDDEPDVRALVAAALETFGAVVVAVGNGKEAVKTPEEDARFDVVFSDLRMPEMSGDELVGVLGRRWPGLVPRVLLTT